MCFVLPLESLSSSPPSKPLLQTLSCKGLRAHLLNSLAHSTFGKLRPRDFPKITQVVSESWKQRSLFHAATNICPLASLLPWPLLQCCRPAFSKSSSLTFPASADLPLARSSKTPIILYRYYRVFVCLVEHFTVAVIVPLLPFYVLCSTEKPFWKTFPLPGHPYLSFDTWLRNCHLWKPFLSTPG